MNCKKNTKGILSLVAFVVLVAVNYLSAMGVINGTSQGGVSAKYPTLITPAGFTFGIWGIIYLLLFVMLVLSLVKRDVYQERFDAIYKPFMLSMAINLAWTFAFAYELIWLSAVLILMLLATLFTILLRLKDGRSPQHGIFELAFGLYAGWISIATLVNFMAFLVSVDFGFFGNPVLVYAIALLLFIALIMNVQRLHNNSFYPLSIVWAFFGITQKQSFASYLNPLFVALVIGMISLLVVDYFVSVRRLERN